MDPINLSSVSTTFPWRVVPIANTFFETSGTNLHGNVVDTDERIDGVHGEMLDTAEMKRGAIVGHLSNYFRVAKISGYIIYQ